METVASLLKCLQPHTSSFFLKFYCENGYSGMSTVRSTDEIQEQIEKILQDKHVESKQNRPVTFVCNFILDNDPQMEVITLWMFCKPCGEVLEKNFKPIEKMDRCMELLKSEKKKSMCESCLSNKNITDIEAAIGPCKRCHSTEFFNIRGIPNRIRDASCHILCPLCFLKTPGRKIQKCVNDDCFYTKIIENTSDWMMMKEFSQMQGDDLYFAVANGNVEKTVDLLMEGHYARYSSDLPLRMAVLFDKPQSFECALIMLLCGSEWQDRGQHVFTCKNCKTYDPCVHKLNTYTNDMICKLANNFIVKPDDRYSLKCRKYVFELVLGFAGSHSIDIGFAKYILLSTFVLRNDHEWCQKMLFSYFSHKDINIYYRKCDLEDFSGVNREFGKKTSHYSNLFDYCDSCSATIVCQEKGLWICTGCEKYDRVWKRFNILTKSLTETKTDNDVSIGESTSCHEEVDEMKEKESYEIKGEQRSSTFPGKLILSKHLKITNRVCLDDGKKSPEINFYDSVEKLQALKEELRKVDSQYYMNFVDDFGMFEPINNLQWSKADTLIKHEHVKDKVLDFVRALSMKSPTKNELLTEKVQKLQEVRSFKGVGENSNNSTPRDEDLSIWQINILKSPNVTSIKYDEIHKQFIIIYKENGGFCGFVCKNIPEMWHNLDTTTMYRFREEKELYDRKTVVYRYGLGKRLVASRAIWFVMGSSCLKDLKDHIQIFKPRNEDQDGWVIYENITKYEVDTRYFDYKRSSPFWEDSRDFNLNRWRHGYGKHVTWSQYEKLMCSGLM